MNYITSFNSREALNLNYLSFAYCQYNTIQKVNYSKKQRNGLNSIYHIHPLLTMVIKGRVNKFELEK